MTDYTKGKIYKLVSTKSPDVYIGSCFIDLCKRLSVHKGKDSKCSSKKMFVDDAIITICLIEAYPCNSKNELKARELFYITNTPCINKNKPFVCELKCTDDGYYKAYYEENKDKFKEYGDKYREENKDKLKEYREENKDKFKGYGDKYREKNKDKFKEYREENKDKFKEYSDKYNSEHKEEKQKYDAKYYEDNKDKNKKYREDNKDEISKKRREWYAKNKLRNTLQNS